MLRISGVAIAALMMVGTAQGATIGLICDGVVQLIVAPEMEKAAQCAVAISGNCTEGFRIENGYFAIAKSDNGSAVGTSAGAHDAPSAAQTAMDTCQGQGDGSCTISVAGNDDGNTYNSCE